MNQLNQCIIEGTVKEVFDSPYFKIETERNGRKDTFLITTGTKKCNLKEGDLVRIVGYLKTDVYYKNGDKEPSERIVVFAEYIEKRVRK